jgi:hypothetical protein
MLRFRRGSKEMRNNKRCEQIAVKLEASAEERIDALGTDDASTGKQLEALDSLFAESRKNPEMFQKRYVQPLLEEGVSLEVAFDLLVAGAIGAN